MAIKLDTIQDCIRDMMQNPDGIKISRAFFMAPRRQEKVTQMLHSKPFEKHKRKWMEKRSYVVPGIQKRIQAWKKFGFVKLVDEKNIQPRMRDKSKRPGKYYLMTYEPLIQYFKMKGIELSQAEKDALMELYSNLFNRFQMLRIWKTSLIDIFLKSYMQVMIKYRRLALYAFENPADKRLKKFLGNDAYFKRLYQQLVQHYKGNESPFAHYKGKVSPNVALAVLPEKFNMTYLRYVILRERMPEIFKELDEKFLKVQRISFYSDIEKSIRSQKTIFDVKVIG